MRSLHTYSSFLVQNSSCAPQSISPNTIDHLVGGVLRTSFQENEDWVVGAEGGGFCGPIALIDGFTRLLRPIRRPQVTDIVRLGTCWVTLTRGFFGESMVVTIVPHRICRKLLKCLPKGCCKQGGIRTKLTFQGHFKPSCHVRVAQKRARSVVILQ